MTVRDCISNQQHKWKHSSLVLYSTAVSDSSKLDQNFRQSEQKAKILVLVKPVPAVSCGICAILSSRMTEQAAVCAARRECVWRGIWGNAVCVGLRGDKQAFLQCHLLQKWLRTTWRLGVRSDDDETHHNQTLNVLKFPQFACNIFRATPSRSNTGLLVHWLCLGDEATICSATVWLKTLLSTFSIDCFLPCCLVLGLWCNGSRRWSRLLNSFTVCIPLKVPLRMSPCCIWTLLE